MATVIPISWRVAHRTFGVHFADVTGDGQGDLVALGRHEFPPAGFDHGLVVVEGLPPASTGIEEPVEQPAAARDGLLSWTVLPNPFSASTHVRMVLAEPQRVTVEVHDVAGRRVHRLHDSKVAAGVEHSFPISSLGLASGVYFVRLEGETFTRSARVTIVR